MIGRKTATAKELQNVLSRREKAAAEAVEATTKLAATEAAFADKMEALALSDCSAEVFHEGRRDLIAESQRALADAGRCDAIYAALSSEADRLAVQVEQERIVALTASCDAGEAERGKLTEALAAVSAKLDADLAELERATLAVSRAAVYTDENAAKAAQLAEQERGYVEWHATHPSADVPSHLRQAVDVERARLRAEVDAGRARLAEESRANLAAVGLDPVAAAEELGIGRPFPRGRTH